MSSATRMRREGLRDGAADGNRSHELVESYRFSFCAIDVRVRTLLSEILSNFHQVHTLLSRIDLLEEGLQVTGAEHADDTWNLLIFGNLSLDVMRW
jgi:hypothetical protein